ncbi:MAG: hypothetical protein AAF317_19910 [Pseudomonadota bacterium]
MTLFLFIAVTLAVGWFVPLWLQPYVPAKSFVLISSLAAIVAGVAATFALAQLLGITGIADAGEEWERGFNAWKIILLWAPAAALYHKGRLNKDPGEGDR